MSETPRSSLHSMRRTSPKGERFVGTCVLCGAESLTTADMVSKCPNPTGVTSDQAVVAALTPAAEADDE